MVLALQCLALHISKIDFFSKSDVMEAIGTNLQGYAILLPLIIVHCQYVGHFLRAIGKLKKIKQIKIRKMYEIFI